MLNLHIAFHDDVMITKFTKCLQGNYYIYNKKIKSPRSFRFYLFYFLHYFSIIIGLLVSCVNVKVSTKSAARAIKYICV